MFPKDPDFAVSRTIGRGRSSPADVQRLRRALNRTGHGSFPEPGGPNVTPGLIDAVKRFQGDFGLEPDAVVRPGGPTEPALSIAAGTRSQQGPAAMDEVRIAFARRARATAIQRSRVGTQLSHQTSMAAMKTPARKVSARLS